jgi:hypothetical protein
MSGELRPKRRRARTVALGTIENLPLQRRVALRVEAKTFAEIRARAIKDGTSFGQACRELLELGLEAALEEESAS